MNPDFSKMNGLIPVIVQDATTSKVLMLGFMNAEAFQKTKDSGLVTFFSRSKNRLWTKGESSGNSLSVQEILLDCDNDTILLKAKPAGPICHTGQDTCFNEQNTDSLSFLRELTAVIEDRKANASEDSYTSSLFAKGLDRICQKVGEEAVELVIAAKGDDRQNIIAEAADLLFHYLTLLSSCEISLDEITTELNSRAQKSSK